MSLITSLSQAKKFKPAYLLSKDANNNLWLFKTKYKYSDFGYSYSLSIPGSDHKHTELQNISSESYSFLGNKFTGLQFLPSSSISKNDFEKYTSLFSSDITKAEPSSDFLKNTLPLSFDLFNNPTIDKKTTDEEMANENTKQKIKTTHSFQQTLF